MRVLVGCEESQEVCKAFRALGHEAYSCDEQECSGGHPEWHIKADILIVLNGGWFTTQGGNRIYVEGWDLGIFFPPCTFLCFAGIRWNTGNPEREKKTEQAILFVLALLHCNIPHIALENPIGVIPKRTKIKWTQIIHPWQYGHEEEKKTCIWLKNLPALIPTKIMQVREQKIFKLSALRGPGSSKDRSKNRSKTFPGIALAMAQQRGSIS